MSTNISSSVAGAGCGMDDIVKQSVERMSVSPVATYRQARSRPHSGHVF